MHHLGRRPKPGRGKSKKNSSLVVETLEPRLMLHHDGGDDPLAYIQMYGNAPPISGPTADGPLGTISDSPLTQGFSYTTQANGLPILNSYPSAPAAIYFDVDGDTNWGGVAPYDLDGDPTTFNAAEQQSILENWWELSMYYSMFNVNVTTIKPAASVPMAWVAWGANPSTDAGVSGVGVFPNDPNGGSQSLAGGGFTLRIGDTLAHEVGHNFGNWHDSTYDNFGNRIDEYAVAPDPLHGIIMGNGPTGVLEKWNWGHSSLGGSVDPTRLQDDMGVIAADLASLVPGSDGYRPDDFGGTIATATSLTVSGTTQSITGNIERTTDSDAFSFNSSGGNYSIVVGRDYPSGVDVKVAVYDANGQLLASEDGDPRAVPYTMVNDTHLNMNLPAGKYYIIVSSHGNYDDQGQYVVRVDPQAAGWQSADIGLVRLPGYDSFNSGTYTVSGSGADIQGSGDEFHYLYQTLTGDGSITARLTSQVNTNSSAKAGIMIRDSLDDGAPNAMITIKPNGATQLQYRTSPDGSTSTVSGSTGPTWIRLTRTGNSIKAETSVDGSTWTTISTKTVSMGSTVYIGLASTAHNVVALSAATFSNVTLTGNINATGVTLNNLLTTPTSASVTSTTSNSATITWGQSWNLNDLNRDGTVDNNDFTLLANNFGHSGTGDINGDGIVDLSDFTLLRNNLGTSGVAGYVIERSSDGINYSPIATIVGNVNTFTDTNLSDAQRYFYRVRAENAAGESAASTVTSGVTRAGAVSNLRVISYTTSQLILDWTDASGETGYKVQRSANGTSGWTTLATLATNTPMYTDSSLTAATQYFYRVVTTDGIGDSATSVVVSDFTRLPAPAPSFTTKASNTMALSWSAITGATGYTVERSTDNVNWTTLVTNQSATTYSDTSVTAVQEYYYRVTAVSATNSSQPSADIFAATPAATALPSPWTTADIGISSTSNGTGAAGLSGSTLTMVGGGADIWGSSDQFRFTYVSMTGNGSITARVASVENTNYYARAGVMIRNTTAANSKYVDMMVHQTDAGVRMQYRSSTGGGATEIDGPSTAVAPYYVRLTRTGNTFLAEYSLDNVTWQQISPTVNVTMNSTVLIGLAVTPRDATFMNKAVFDTISVTTSTGTIVLGGAGSGTDLPAGGDGLAAANTTTVVNSSSAAHTSAATFTTGSATSANPPVAGRLLADIWDDFDRHRSADSSIAAFVQSLVSAERNALPASVRRQIEARPSTDAIHVDKVFKSFAWR